MELDSILQLAGFAFGLVTVAGTLYWRVQVMIKEVRDEAALRAEASLAVARTAEKDLAAHKLHVAEVYTTKVGLQSVTDQIMDAIGGIGAQITSMNGRIDRMLERPAARASTTRVQ
jgi:hypothetical protein